MAFLPCSLKLSFISYSISMTLAPFNVYRLFSLIKTKCFHGIIACVQLSRASTVSANIQFSHNFYAFRCTALSSEHNLLNDAITRHTIPWMVDVLACHKLTQKLKCQWSHQHSGPFVPLAHTSLSYSFNIKKHSEFQMLMELLNGILYWFCVHRYTSNAELSVINRTEFGSRFHFRGLLEQSTRHRAVPIGRSHDFETVCERVSYSSSTYCFMRANRGSSQLSSTCNRYHQCTFTTLLFLFFTLFPSDSLRISILIYCELCKMCAA